MASGSRNKSDRTRKRNFKNPFDGSDIKFIVQQHEFYANQSTLRMSSDVFSKLIDAENEKKISNIEIITVDLSQYRFANSVTADDFEDMMKILHLPAKYLATVFQDRARIVRLLPVLRLLHLGDLIETCEEKLLGLPRHLQDFIISSDYEFKKLKHKSLEWASVREYSEITSDPDWGLVGERHRLEIFEKMLKRQEKNTDKLRRINSTLEIKKDTYKDFVVGVEDIINGRGHEDVSLGSTMCRHPTEETEPHMKAQERDCKQCRWDMISMIHNLFQMFRNRRPSEFMDNSQ